MNIHFEPAGAPSPIGHYKAYIGYDQNHHFSPESHGGTVFNDGGQRRWLHFNDPTTCLTFSPCDTMCLLEKAVVGHDVNYIEINARCPSDWGVRANYIDILPAFFGGLAGVIRLLPCIPQSQHDTATCILIRSLFSPAGKDSYAVNFWGGTDGFDPALFTEDPCCNRFCDHFMLIRAFNNLAHARGLKTGFTTIINSDQLNFNGTPFNWHNLYHKEHFINACVFAIASLGFDAIHFDSARHIGGFDHNGNYHFWDPTNYKGVGIPPSFEIMQQITHEIRRRSQRQDLSFLGEYADEHSRYYEMGLNVGIAYDATKMSKQAIHELGSKQTSYSSYRSGVFVSNDNDNGLNSWPSRLEATYNSLIVPTPKEKLPVLFTQNDLWPMLIGYHDLILNPQHWTHEHGLFHPQTAEYTWRMHEIWAQAARQ